MKTYYYYLPSKMYEQNHPINPYEIKAENEKEVRKLIREKHNLKSVKGCEIWQSILESYK